MTRLEYGDPHGAEFELFAIVKPVGYNMQAGSAAEGLVYWFRCLYEEANRRAVVYFNQRSDSDEHRSPGTVC